MWRCTYTVNRCSLRPFDFRLPSLMITFSITLMKGQSCVSILCNFREALMGHQAVHLKFLPKNLKAYGPDRPSCGSSPSVFSLPPISPCFALEKQLACIGVGSCGPTTYPVATHTELMFTFTFKQSVRLFNEKCASCGGPSVSDLNGLKCRLALADCLRWGPLSQCPIILPSPTLHPSTLLLRQATEKRQKGETDGLRRRSDRLSQEEGCHMGKRWQLSFIDRSQQLNSRRKIKGAHSKQK